MASHIVTIANQGYQIFSEPFHLGFSNIHAGIFGKKVEVVVAQNRWSPDITRGRNLSLIERVSACAIGMTLLVPIVNVLVLTILRSLNCNKLYASLNTHVGSGNPQRISVTEPVSETITAEAMLQRKRDALARLTAIENMISAAHQDPLTELRNRFAPHADILSFDLDSVLRRYDANHQPSKLIEFMDWANVDPTRRYNFEAEVTEYDHVHFPQEFMAKKLLINIAEYFVQAKARLEGTLAEEELKVKFNQVVDSILDASRNCIDQTLNQLQTLVLDIVAEGDTNQQMGSVQRKLINQAGLALCKYRTHLLQEILRRQNPNEEHMADLERLVTQRLVAELGLRGGIFSSGAAYSGFFYSNADHRTELVRRAFQNEYKPFELLLNDLKTPIGVHRTLRNEILSWARDYYDLASEDVNPIMDHRISEDIDRYTAASQGGNLKLSAVVLFLEQVGLIQEIPSSGV